MDTILTILPVLITVIVLLNFFVRLIGHRPDKYDRIYRAGLNVGPALLAFDRRQFTDSSRPESPA